MTTTETQSWLNLEALATPELRGEIAELHRKITAASEKLNDLRDRYAAVERQVTLAADDGLLRPLHGDGAVRQDQPGQDRLLA